MKTTKFEVEVGLHKRDDDDGRFYTERAVVKVQVSEDRMRGENPKTDGMTRVLDWEMADENGRCKSKDQLRRDNPSWVEDEGRLWRPMTTKEMRREFFELAINDAIRKRAKDDGYRRAERLFSAQSSLTPDFLPFGHNLRDVYYDDGDFVASIPVKVLNAEEI
jgi:hypothetical protein